jgi:tRNA threonylcarbamoyladenosine biosynthesis protein TsaE
MDSGSRFFIGKPEEMTALGMILGRNLFKGAVVGLSGPLGAGKTTLAGGIAEGMEIDSSYVVSSPTYTLLQTYPCSRGDLHHLDLYRIQGPGDLDSTGYRDHLGGSAVLVVEWPEKEPSVLPGENLMILIDYQENGREVTLVPSGHRYEELVEKITERFLGDP